MARNDQEIIIVPRQSKGVRRLPPLALLVVNRSEADMAVSLALADGARRHSFFHWQVVVDRQERYCLAGPALGAPAAGILMEQMIAHGVKRFILLSCCGNLDPVLEIGDLVLPVSAVTGMNLSRWYTDEEVVYTDASLRQALETFASRQGWPYRTGVIWSTDAPYLERRSELLALRERYGVGFVDMECSSLLAVAAFREVSIGALFVVSDQLWARRWQPGFASPSFRQRCEAILKAFIHDGGVPFLSDAWCSAPRTIDGGSLV